MKALTRAARRGVTVRIYRSRAGDAHGAPTEAYEALRAAPGVTIRIKRSKTYMHLKSYEIDGRWLRTGAANFSASGLKRQDNDLVILESPALAEAFKANFESIFAGGEPDTAPGPGEK